jgi:hypothetical protein
MASCTYVLCRDCLVPKVVDNHINALDRGFRLEQLLKDIVVGYPKPAFGIAQYELGSIANFRQPGSKKTGTHYFGQAWAYRLNRM